MAALQSSTLPSSPPTRSTPLIQSSVASDLSGLSKIIQVSDEKSERSSIIGSKDNDLVLVTGATGFIGGHIIKKLLQNGYRVRGTVRKLSQNIRYEYLYKFIPNNDKSRLEIIESDVSKSDNWKKAVLGCRYVIHAANRMVINSRSSDADTEDGDSDRFVKPALGGIRFVLEACADKESCVERVILTSSVFAAQFTPKDENCRVKVVSANDWTDLTVPNHPYMISKTKVEQYAWQFVKENNETKNVNQFELVCLNPAAIVGPALKAEMPPSLDLVTVLMTMGVPMVPNITYGWVDVREVATAHINALKAENANGKRYILMAQSLAYPQIAAILNNRYASMGYTIPSQVAPDWLFRLAPVSSVKINMIPFLSLTMLCDNTPSIRDLGVMYRPLTETIYGAVDSAIEFHLIPKPNEIKSFVSTVYDAASGDVLWDYSSYFAQMIVSHSKYAAMSVAVKSKEVAWNVGETAKSQTALLTQTLQDEDAANQTWENVTSTVESWWTTASDHVTKVYKDTFDPEAYS